MFIKRGRNNRAAGHVEMIISFALFVIIVSFILIYLKPYEKPVLTNTVLSNLHDSFINEVQINLKSVFLKITPETGASCSLIDLKEFDLDDNLNENSFVITKDGDYIESKLAGKNLRINSIQENVYLFVSSEFESTQVSCSEKANYTAGSIVTRKIISNNSLTLLKEQYESNYADLKIKFNVPSTMDFSIVSPGFVLEKQVPNNININARTIYEGVLYSNGSIENKQFILKAW